MTEEHNNTRFVPYDQVDIERLQQAADLIQSLSTKRLRQIACSGLRVAFEGKVTGKMRDIRVARRPLLRVPDAMVRVEFDRSSFRDETVRLAGLSRRLPPTRRAEPCLPVAYVFLDDPVFAQQGLDPEAVIEHEQVHLCQSLLDSHWPLTRRDADMVSTMNLRDAAICVRDEDGSLEALRFIDRVACGRLWTEGEAVYVTGTRTRWEWARETCRLAMPTRSANRLSMMLAARLDSGDASKALRPILMLPGFCREMQQTVPWVRDMYRDTTSPSALFTDIVEHEENWTPGICSAPERTGLQPHAPLCAGQATICQT